MRHASKGVSIDRSIVAMRILSTTHNAKGISPAHCGSCSPSVHGQALLVAGVLV